MSSRRSRVGLALAGLLLVLGSLSPGADARAGPATASWRGGAGACTDDSGVTVVVDATAFGDGVHVRCAPQPVRSGFEALTKAGFTYEGTVRFPGLLCRIDGEPASDPCHGPPPPDAYWAYWHAPRGGSWTYSTSGAGGRVPPPGSVEGWAFGDDARPRVAPPAPAPTPTTRAVTTTSTVGSSPAAGGGGAAAPGPADGTSPGSPARSTTTTTTAGQTAATSTDPDADPGSEVDGAGPDEELAAATTRKAGSGGGGSPAGAVAGAGIAAAIASATFVTMRRRAAEADGS
jgi:hypothetical protein